MLVAGVDVGSTQTKAVIMDTKPAVVGRALIDTGARLTDAANHAYQLALKDARRGEHHVAAVTGTGYGRFRVEFGDAQVTEISCHARGASFLYPHTVSVLDVGGQDTKAIRVGEAGQVLDFCMNDKCSAGTGRFLGAASTALDIPLGDLGPLALTAKNPVKMTTTCTVFAESEILGWLALGRKVEDVLMGVHVAIASRSVSLLRRVGIEPEITFTGGVARNTAMVSLLQELTDCPINVSEESHYCGAIGAALYALDRALADQAGQQAGGVTP